MPSAKKTTTVSEERLMHPHWEDMGRKIMLTLLGILVAYAIVFLGTLIRNNLREYHTIGQADRMERTITLEAQGKATVKPDVAMTTIGMIATAETVAEAQAENTAVMNELVNRLKALEISEDDIQTSNYNIYPTYNYTEEDGRVLEGYEVSQSVSIKIRDLEKANSVIALAGEVGANSVSGLQFTIDDTDQYKETARDEAMKKIKEKANTLTDLLGVDLVSVVSYNEYEGGYGYPVYDRSFAVMEGLGGAVPDIEAGSEDVILNVAVTFEIR